MNLFSLNVASKQKHEAFLKAYRYYAETEAGRWLISFTFNCLHDEIAL